jgi:hypothetical protein
VAAKQQPPLEQKAAHINNQTIQAPPAKNAATAQGCEAFRGLVARYDWDVRTMLAIMRAESGCDPNVTGDTSLTFTQNGRTYGYSVSLFQVRVLPGREACDSHDPATNISCAYRVWKSQGYKAWSVYTNGKYAKFL